MDPSKRRTEVPRKRNQPEGLNGGRDWERWSNSFTKELGCVVVVAAVDDDASLSFSLPIISLAANPKQVTNPYKINTFATKFVTVNRRISRT